MPDGIAAGDPTGEANRVGAWSLDLLYRAHAPRLLRYFALRAGRDAADDLVHEAFVRLARLSGDRARGIEQPEAYLGRMATNLLRDRARLAARRALPGTLEGCGDTEDPVDPQQVLEQRDALLRLERALSAMHPRRKKIFLLHRLENRTYAEIASDTGLSVKGVKKQMAKALAELRRVLADQA